MILYAREQFSRYIQARRLVLDPVMIMHETLDQDSKRWRIISNKSPSHGIKVIWEKFDLCRRTPITMRWVKLLTQSLPDVAILKRELEYLQKQEEFVETLLEYSGDEIMDFKNLIYSGLFQGTDQYKDTVIKIIQRHYPNIDHNEISTRWIEISSALAHLTMSIRFPCSWDNE